MELYDGLIRLLTEAADGTESRFSPENACAQTGPGTIILSKETAFEYGGSALPAIGGVLFTTDRDVTDGVILCGGDIAGTDADTAYARFAVIALNEESVSDDDRLYTTLKNIELTKYHVYPEGCLLRLSPESRREQLRIGKKAAAGGLSLRNIGCAFINEYKKDPAVRAVKIYFFTGKDCDYKLLGTIADKASAVTESLNKILNGIEISCDTCELKPICDEVDGLRKLHFGKER